MTQWIASCRCDAIIPVEEQLTTLNLCTTCGKRINQGRVGSFTQFIFRFDLCSCDKPAWAPVALAPSELEETAKLEQQEEIDIDESLVVEPNSFPADRYKPLRIIGAGAGGTVYLCRDTVLNKLVAVKTLHTLVGEQLVAFQNEARLLSKLDHPGIVGILDFGATKSGAPYMVLEHSESFTLRKALEENGPLMPESARQIFVSLSEALRYCHERGVFHRDLKPENILFTQNADNTATVKLIDFGIAIAGSQEATAEAIDVEGRKLIGTPAYMPPDQILGRAYDARSEIYSLGCVLFESITGIPPFSGETPLEVLSHHATDDAPLLSDVIEASIPEDLEDIISICLSKQQDERFQSMEELLSALKSPSGAGELPEHYRPVSDAGESKAGSSAAGLSTARSSSAGSSPSGLSAARLSAAGLSPAGLSATGISDVELADIERSGGSVATDSKRSDARFALIAKIMVASLLVGAVVSAVVIQSTNQHSKKTDAETTVKKPHSKPVEPEKPYLIERRGGFVQISGDHINREAFKELAVLCKERTSVAFEDLPNNVDWSGLELLAGSSIRSLMVRHTTFGDEQCKIVAKFPKLVKLDSRSTNISNAGVEALATSKSLIQFEFSSTKVTGDCIRILSKYPSKVRWLGIADLPSLTVRDLEGIRRFPNLTILDVSSNKLGDDALRLLSKMGPLQELTANAAGITDSGTKYLAGSNITTISLADNSGITDNTIPYLLKMPHLQRVQFGQSTRISKAGEEALQRARPHLKIKHDHGMGYRAKVTDAVDESMDDIKAFDAEFLGP